MHENGFELLRLFTSNTFSIKKEGACVFSVMLYVSETWPVKEEYSKITLDKYRQTMKAQAKCFPCASLEGRIVLSDYFSKLSLPVTSYYLLRVFVFLVILEIFVNIV